MNSAQPSTQPSTAHAPGRSLPSRFPRAATLVTAVGLFAVSMGLLYATILAVGRDFAVVVLLAATWFLSVQLVALVVRPYFHRLKTRTRTVPDGLDGSVEAACARNGLAVRRSWLTAKTPGPRPAEVAGLPWDRHLVVDEWFFASLSSAEREALVAREAELVRRRYQLYRHAMPPVVVAVVAGLYALASPGWLAGGAGSLAFGTVGVGLYALAARRVAGLILAADRHAARETSREAVAGLLAKTASMRDDSAGHRWPLSVLAMYPTTDRRIARLRAS